MLTSEYSSSAPKSRRRIHRPADWCLREGAWASRCISAVAAARHKCKPARTITARPHTTHHILSPPRCGAVTSPTTATQHSDGLTAQHQIFESAFHHIYNRSVWPTGQFLPSVLRPCQSMANHRIYPHKEMQGSSHSLARSSQ